MFRDKQTGLLQTNYKGKQVRRARSSNQRNDTRLQAKNDQSRWHKTPWSDEGRAEKEWNKNGQGQVIWLPESASTLNPQNQTRLYHHQLQTLLLQVEHLVVLRDQELWQEQRKNDKLEGASPVDEADRIHPDPTRIELSAEETAGQVDYQGKGRLVITPSNVEVFTDEACKTKFNLDEKIEKSELIGKTVKLWLRGKTAGKFNVKLELDPSNDPRIKIDPPAEGEMGCVELKLKLHHYKKDDVNKAINPDVKKSPAPTNDPPTDNGMDPQKYWDQLKDLKFEQKEMSDSERIGTGRLLHVQKDKNHSRAKLIVEKVDGSQWPDAASAYLEPVRKGILTQ